MCLGQNEDSCSVIEKFIGKLTLTYNHILGNSIEEKLINQPLSRDLQNFPFPVSHSYLFHFLIHILVWNWIYFPYQVFQSLLAQMLIHILVWNWSQFPYPVFQSWLAHVLIHILAHILIPIRNQNQNLGHLQFLKIDIFSVIKDL